MLKTFGFTMPKLWSTGSLDLKTSRRKFVPCTTPGSPILGGFIWPDRLRVSEPARCNCFKSRLGAQIASPCIGYEILCMRPQGPQGARTHACIQCLNVWQTWVLSPSLIRTPIQSTMRAALALSRVTNDRLRLPRRR